MSNEKKLPFEQKRCTVYFMEEKNCKNLYVFENANVNYLRCIKTVSNVSKLDRYQYSIDKS